MESNQQLSSSVPEETTIEEKITKQFKETTFANEAKALLSYRAAAMKEREQAKLLADFQNVKRLILREGKCQMVLKDARMQDCPRDSDPSLPLPNLCPTHYKKIAKDYAWLKLPDLMWKEHLSVVDKFTEAKEEKARKLIHKRKAEAEDEIAYAKGVIKGDIEEEDDPAPRKKPRRFRSKAKEAARVQEVAEELKSVGLDTPLPHCYECDEEFAEEDLIKPFKCDHAYCKACIGNRRDKCEKKEKPFACSGGCKALERENIRIEQMDS